MTGSSEAAVPVLVLFGPTASGKTEILRRLFVDGPAIPAEVVSADSMQVYRGMDIGTAKPDREERERLPHHLIDIRNPDEQFNAGDFVRLASDICLDIRRRGKLPVVSGGTGFYLKNFILGLPAAPPSDPAIRRALKGELRERGAAALMEELERADPVSAGRIHRNDQYRLIRALEVCRLTGRPLSSFAPPGGEEGEGPRSRFRFLLIALERDRDDLYRRINARCAAMFRRGLAGELRGLWEAGYGPDDPGMRAIGYREFFVEEEPGRYRLSGDIASVEALVARNSRRYAKRQICYFAPIPGVKRVHCGPEGASGTTADPVRRIREEIELFLSIDQGR
ncbi:MAG: tRNA (adenosine(37)-N6)-dimethylallyltransferase MiaA [Treponema sp.]|jgi:tRNA dimethylallyltransferase|nr:tRNA (adenosine(37)-N6)-dimethylallyltransferase MiaA [Treponema sp.]